MSAFSFNLLKTEGHPSLSLPLTHMTSAEALDRQTLRLTFSGRQSARTVLDVVAFPIVSKRYFTEKQFSGNGLEPPLGSGPYKVGRVVAGRTIEYDRVDDYWAQRPADQSRPVQFRPSSASSSIATDRPPSKPSRKATSIFRQEFVSRVWATGYDFPALAEGKVVKREFPGEKRPSMQAVAVNQRRERFRDARVRQAIGMCFDFEWTNRNLFLRCL